MTTHLFPLVEPLESRIAPATLVNPTTVTYQDIDGDLVTLKITKPLFEGTTIGGVLQFSTGGVDGSNTTAQQLQTLNLTALANPADAAGLGITMTAAKSAFGGDGKVNLGTLEASNIDLGAVSIAGDLSKIDCGSGGTMALKSLTLRSMGAAGFTSQASGNLYSYVSGELGSLKVKGDVQDVIVLVFGANGKIGTATIGGSMKGSNITTSSDIGSVSIRHDMIAGFGSTLGAIDCGGSLTKITVGGSVIGGQSDRTGSIFAAGTLGSVTIAGSLLGGTADNTGHIKAAAIGKVKIGHDVLGGPGFYSGAIESSTTGGSIMIGGSIIAGTGNSSGDLVVLGACGPVTIKGSLVGGAGSASGVLSTNASFGAIKIGGDIIGGSNNNTGGILCFGPIASIALGGSLFGSSVVGSSLQATGFISAGGTIGPMKIGGDIIGGRAAGSGGSVNGSGAINAGRLASLIVGGSIYAGALAGNGTSVDSGVVRSRSDIPLLVVKGGIYGDSTNPVNITAQGTGMPVNGVDLAFGRISIGGDVAFANILAGYVTNGAVLADVQIGSVTVGGRWQASNLVCGIARGSDSYFGDANDVVISGGDPNIIAKIGSIIVHKEVIGSGLTNSDHFGIVAEQFGSVSIDGKKLMLSPGPHNDPLRALAITGDVFLREI